MHIFYTLHSFDVSHVRRSEKASLFNWPVLFRALLTGAIMLSLFLGGKYLLIMDQKNNPEMPLANITELG